ncbi:hypothetical protein FQN60_007035 [Etheostoma spectabile]|uniref:Uncharacterized protein n=1 Tax=Etheostoma spectabile TaxID=54343 RepID=A0A5J5CA97_9PERO|nr:hypothetical protein FQN60_007035 [Etheostoma spectabile]
MRLLRRPVRLVPTTLNNEGSGGSLTNLRQTTIQSCRRQTTIQTCRRQTTIQTCRRQTTIQTCRRRTI